MVSLRFDTSSTPRFALVGRRSRRILLSLAVLTTLAAAPSIANAHPYVGVGVHVAAPGIRVSFAPPMPRVEYRHVWTAGYYQAPRRGWVWEPAHWQPQFAGGYVYIPGHWRHTWQPVAYRDGYR